MIRGYSISEEDIDRVMPFVRGVIHELEVGNATNIELSLLNLGPCQFMDVFDVHFFKKHYKTYLRRLFINAKMKNEFYSKKIYPYYANQISIWDKMKWILAIILNKFVHKHVEV